MWTEEEKNNTNLHKDCYSEESKCTNYKPDSKWHYTVICKKGKVTKSYECLLQFTLFYDT